MAKYQIQSLIDTLVKARRVKGYSQAQVGEKLSFPQSYISSIEHGKRDIRLSTFVELARLLDLEVILLPRLLAGSVYQLIGDYTGEPIEDERAFIPTGDDDDE